MALTAGNVTLKLSGGSYSTWAGFWNDLGNLTGDINCAVDASAFTEAAAPANVTESLGGFTLHVYPASFPTTTDATTGARFTLNHTGANLSMEMEGPGTVIIEGLVFIEGTSSPAYCIYLTSVGTEFDFIVRRNIIKGCGYGLYQHDATVNSGTQWYNNIIYDVTTSYGIYIYYDIPLALIANNTLHNCPNNVVAGDEEVTFTNNLSYAGTSRCFYNIELLTNGYNNAESDNTGQDADWGGTGSGNLSSISDPFNNLAADDFTISEAGGAVIGSAGLDLSAYFTTDFFAVTRSNWTIGACEYVSGGTPVNVEGTTDALALTENASAVRTNRNVLASVKQMAITALAASVVLSTNVQTTPDVLSCTPQAATIKVDTNVQVGLDELTLVGRSATVNAETNIQAGLDTLSVVTPQADVNLDVAVGAGTDALALTEFAATVNAEENIVAGYDALALTEYVAAVNAEINVEAGADTLAITTYEAGVALPIIVSATTDNLVLTGQAATVNAEINVETSTDALAISEKSATVNAEVSIQAGSDALSISTKQAGINAEISVAAGIDNLLLTEKQAVVNAETNVQASTDGLTLVGKSATVSVESVERDVLLIRSLVSVNKHNRSLIATLQYNHSQIRHKYQWDAVLGIIVDGYITKFLRVYDDEFYVVEAPMTTDVLVTSLISKLKNNTSTISV